MRQSTNKLGMVEHIDDILIQWFVSVLMKFIASLDSLELREWIVEHMEELRLLELWLDRWLVQTLLKTVG